MTILDFPSILVPSVDFRQLQWLFFSSCSKNQDCLDPIGQKSIFSKLRLGL
ncbi:hypothetical protein Scep_012308 [Stephania cephalantha]|uniref:Uncharacterized protein n=1 Tax=Stephania cephalantha TaxID=152367 RepID=A0AAP0JGV7_9MAGN